MVAMATQVLLPVSLGCLISLLLIADRRVSRTRTEHSATLDGLTGLPTHSMPPAQAQVNLVSTSYLLVFIKANCNR